MISADVVDIGPLVNTALIAGVENNTVTHASFNWHQVSLARLSQIALKSENPQLPYI